MCIRDRVSTQSTGVPLMTTEVTTAAALECAAALLEQLDLLHGRGVWWACNLQLDQDQHILRLCEQLVSTYDPDPCPQAQCDGLARMLAVAETSTRCQALRNALAEAGVVWSGMQLEVTRREAGERGGDPVVVLCCFNGPEEQQATALVRVDHHTEYNAAPNGNEPEISDTKT
eukprot:TRINITY_DN5372_c0_g1_i2.p2 TRINITY_DN5372_c0_g1~~TRINITY_DN5372_c0_g1_i2.p2  ORF type:complete len:173 (-),score=52.80 TRINITY_DN5372_c0_g1_i2:223-741(-)